jgi:hypothetical protein
MLADMREPRVFWFAKSGVAFLIFPFHPAGRGFPGEGARSPGQGPSALQVLSLQ